jgi:alpha-1,3-rhamnosyltransferase
MDQIKNEARQDTLVSILVLTYNHAKYIEQCLLSLQSISFPSRHIWVLDDGSTDETPDIVRRLAAEGGGVTLLTQANTGGRTALNLQRLLDESTGKYVMFMSGDDMVGPGFSIRSMYQLLEASSRLGLIIPRALMLNSNPAKQVEAMHSNLMLELLRDGEPERVLSEHLSKQVSSIFIQGMVIRRDLLDKSGGFDVDLTADDYVLVCKIFLTMKKMDMKFYFDEKNFWIYRVHESNIHRNHLRQLTAITEVVGRYISKEHWDSFDWHVMPMNTFEDLKKAEAIITKNMGPGPSKDIVDKVIVRSLVSWLEIGNFKEILECFSQARNLIRTRFEITRCLCRALPKALVGVSLKNRRISDALRSLSVAAQRRTQ